MAIFFGWGGGGGGDLVMVVVSDTAMGLIMIYGVFTSGFRFNSSWLQAGLGCWAELASEDLEIQSCMMLEREAIDAPLSHTVATS